MALTALAVQQLCLGDGLLCLRHLQRKLHLLDGDLRPKGKTEPTFFIVFLLCVKHAVRLCSISCVLVRCWPAVSGCLKDASALPVCSDPGRLSREKGEAA